MLTSFGWSTVGAEQNDPDTLNHLLFGPTEMSSSFGDLIFDQHDDYSSFGVSGASKEEESVINGTDWGTSASRDNEIFIPGTRIRSCLYFVDETTNMISEPTYPMEGNSTNIQMFVFRLLSIFLGTLVPIVFSNRVYLFPI